MTSPRRLLRLAEVRLRARAGAIRIFLAVMILGPPVVRAVGSGAERTAAVIFAVSIYGLVILSLLVAVGGPAAEVRSGAAALWLQKPVSPPVLYLTGLAPRLLLGFLIPILTVGLGSTMLALLGTHDVAYQFILALPTLVLVSLVVVSGAYAASGLGLAPEGLMSVLFLLGLVAPRLLVVLRPELTVGWEPAIDLLAVPVDQIEIAGRYLGRGLHGEGLQELLVVARFCAIWLTAGTVGSIWTMRSPIRRSED